MTKYIIPSAPAADDARLGRPTIVLRDAHTIRDWLVRHREALWIGLLVLAVTVAHGYNMFGFPYYESDEGTYMSQAWAILRLGKLAPYTYWYDHAPGGWIQIAAWTVLTGGFYTFGSPVNGGRVLMLLMQAGSTWMVYQIGRRIAKGWLAPTLAVLAFGFSAYGTYYQRRVLLDNITTFWMLLSIVLLLREQLTLRRVWLSALALGIAMLSKELTVFLIPALALLVWTQTAKSQRALATIGWVAIAGSIFSTYFLMAVLKGELFPTGTWLGGSQPHVSLLGSLQYQSSRGTDAGLFDLNSGFWTAIKGWMVEEPLLVIAGSLAAIVSALLIRWWRLGGILGLVTLSLYGFMARGGVTLPFYLVPLLPLLALNLALLTVFIIGGLTHWLRRVGRPGLIIGRGVQVVAALALIAAIPLGYRNPNLEFGKNPLTLWTSSQANVNTLVANWVIQNVPPRSRIIIDQSLWLDLRENPQLRARFDNAHYYWKVAQDPEIRNGVFNNDWRTVDYVITTNQMLGDTNRARLNLISDALARSTLVASFDTGGWPVEIRQVQRPYQSESATTILQKTWTDYTARFIENGRVIDRGANGRTTSEGQSYALLRAVYVNDRQTFDQVWAWTKANMQQPSGLLGWLYGTKPDGTVGLLDAGAATDGDQDTALALLFASKRWVEPRYQNEARTILNGLWEQGTTTVAGKRILVAGPWARGDAQNDPVVNPSYFAPYAYRIFAEADPVRNWLQLVDSTYDVLGRIRADARFGGQAGFAPNWVALDAATGALRPATNFGSYANEYSYDALRLPWRVALDWLWFNDPRARAALQGLDGVQQAYVRDGRLAAAYKTDGTPAANYESLAMYAGALGSTMFSNDRTVPYQMYAEKLLSTYRETPQGAYWGDPNNYYDQNWAWFATGLVNGKLGNLWAGKESVF